METILHKGQRQCGLCGHVAAGVAVRMCVAHSSPLFKGGHRPRTFVGLESSPPGDRHILASLETLPRWAISGYFGPKFAGVIWIVCSDSGLRCFLSALSTITSTTSTFGCLDTAWKDAIKKEKLLRCEFRGWPTLDS